MCPILSSSESSYLCLSPILGNTQVLTCLALVFVMVSEIDFFLSFTAVLENNSSNSWQSMDGSSIFSQISEALVSLKLSRRPMRPPSNRTQRHHHEHTQKRRTEGKKGKRITEDERKSGRKEGSQEGKTGKRRQRGQEEDNRRKEYFFFFLRLPLIWSTYWES